MKKHLVPASFVFSIVSIAWTLLINKWIADRYLIADGKTRALFGITELFQFGYQYYVVLIGILAAVLASIGIMKKHRRAVLALVISIFAI